jgi:hypothetical protein
MSTCTKEASNHWSLTDPGRTTSGHPSATARNLIDYGLLLLQTPIFSIYFYFYFYFGSMKEFGDGLGIL